ncbi:MAG: tRNA pseudouridine(38-40) synthase TruA [Bacteroidetes bacterium]|nr:tRNA pseudouridine(38-40) synthase TruA [Bacteroidota bacterium]
MTQRFAFFCEYNGAGFNGWQLQAPEKAPVTVQSVLESAFRQFLHDPDFRIHGSGRTDTGVHATGQCFHADLPEGTDTGRLIRGINGIAGDHPVAIWEARPVRPDFHARFSATSRLYHYTLNTRPSPLNRHKEWFYPYPLKPDQLREMASLIRQATDFSSFCRAADEADHKRCRILECDWKTEDSRLIFSIRANRFLYGMVRALVGTQLDLIRRGEHPESLSKLLDARNRQAAGPAAKAHGLTLVEVTYPAECFLS